jgi:hypothetical protein
MSICHESRLLTAGIWYTSKPNKASPTMAIAIFDNLVFSMNGIVSELVVPERLDLEDKDYPLRVKHDLSAS